MNQSNQQLLAQKIRAQYTEQTPTDLDTLRALDAKVKRPANVFSYLFGGIGAVIMGSGMSLVMTDLAAQLGMGDMTVAGILIGVVGMTFAMINYPIHKAIVRSRKRKYAAEILNLSEKIMKQ